MKRKCVAIEAMLLLLSVVTPRAAGQDHPATSPASQKPTVSQCAFSEVYRAGGWTIPGLHGSVPKGPRAAVVFRTEGVEESKASGIFATPLKAGKTDSRLTVLQCSPMLPERFYVSGRLNALERLNAPGRLIARVLTVKVMEMWRFDLENRVFAYGVTYEPQLMTPNGLRGSLELITVLFYDPDGAGKFTVMKFSEYTIFRSLEVPDWVKRPGSQSTQPVAH